MVVYTIFTDIETYNKWGCTGFDVVIGRSGLRVRELFSVINGQTKLNDNKVVSLADRRAAKEAAALLAA